MCEMYSVSVVMLWAVSAVALLPKPSVTVTEGVVETAGDVCKLDAVRLAAGTLNVPRSMPGLASNETVRVLPEEIDEGTSHARTSPPWVGSPVTLGSGRGPEAVVVG